MREGYYLHDQLDFMRISIISSIVVPMPPECFFFFYFCPSAHSRARCDVPPTKRRTLCGYITQRTASKGTSCSARKQASSASGAMYTSI